jgi:hypothetical protein
MPEETTEVTPDPKGTPDVSAEVAAPAESSEQVHAASLAVADAPAAESAHKEPESLSPESANGAESTSEQSAEAKPQEPDAIQPFIDKAFETIAHEVDNEELGKFLRAHIKTFREEWDALSDTAKDAYVHMMTSQLVQRKAAATRIKIYEEFKLPVPSAQTTLFESIKQSQIKPKKRQPVLLMPPNLRPTYSLKK